MSIGKYDQNGASLIETLIALFLLAIGLLGVLSLQVTSINSNQRALFRSDALNIATDMVDQMYAIRDSAYSGLVTATAISDVAASLRTEFNNLDTDSAPETAPDCQNDGCDLAGQADVAAYNWSQSVASRLPSGRGRITEAGGVYTITVFWNEDKNPAGVGLDCSGDSSVDLQCFVMEIQL